MRDERPTDGPRADDDTWSNEELLTSLQFDAGRWSEEPMLRVLRCLHDQAGMSPTTIALGADMPRASVYDLLRQMKATGSDPWAERAFILGLDGKRYLQQDSRQGQAFVAGVRELHRRGWSMRRLAAEFGTSHAAVSRWLRA